MMRQLTLTALLTLSLTMAGCCNPQPSVIPPAPKLSRKTFDAAPAAIATLIDGRLLSTVADASSRVLVGPMSLEAANGPIVAALEDHTILRVEENASTLLAGKRSHIPYRGFEGGFADGPGPSARFHGITAIRRLPGGGFVLADSANHRIRRIGPDGAVSTLAGTGSAGSADGSSAQAEFNHPWGLAVAPDGTIFVSDSRNHTIRSISPDGQVTTVAGTGAAGSTDGEAHRAKFHGPRGLALDAQGTLYVADSGNHAVRAIRSNGLVSTLAGSAPGGFHDGPRGSAKFLLPSAVTLSPSGDILVADTLNHAIRRVSTTGAVTTLAGGGQAKLESDRESDFANWGHRDGQKEDALFHLPFDLVVDETGRLLVADSGNCAIRAVTLER